MCRRDSAADGMDSKLSISGASSRSGARISAAAASSPRTAPLMTTIVRPRKGGGISSIGGTLRMRNAVVTSSGAVTAQAAQRVRTSCARDPSQTSHPAYAVSIG
jgi:hypothetical protein